MRVTIGGLWIEGAFYRAGAALKYMSVDHGGFYVFVAEQLLDGADIVAVLQ